MTFIGEKLKTEKIICMDVQRAFFSSDSAILLIKIDSFISSTNFPVCPAFLLLRLQPDFLWEWGIYNNVYVVPVHSPVTFFT